MSRRVSTTSGDVPFLHANRIRDEAELVLANYGQQVSPVTAPPVPIDDILELHLQLTFEIADLLAEFQCADVMGAIWIKKRAVKVDRSLDPALNPKRLGRYRYTLAHEAGHWCLHRQHYLENVAQGKLFAADGAPAFICRSSEAKKPVEYQADRFAADLLMPERLVRSEWLSWRGNLESIFLDDLRAKYQGEAQSTAERYGGGDPEQVDNLIFEMFARPLAERFQVSPTATRICLEQHGWLLREKGQFLFS